MMDEIEASLDELLQAARSVSICGERQLAEKRRAFLASVRAHTAVAGWAHEEDPTRVISAAQKAQAERDGGASASSVRLYSVPLVRGGQ